MIIVLLKHQLFQKQIFMISLPAQIKLRPDCEFKKTTHTSPSWVSYGVSVMSILEKKGGSNGTTLHHWSLQVEFHSTHCGILTPYGYICRGQHWLRSWLVAWQHQAITWTDVDLSSSIRSCGIHLWALSSEDLKIPISKTRLKIAFRSPRGRRVNIISPCRLGGWRMP